MRSQIVTASKKSWGISFILYLALTIIILLQFFQQFNHILSFQDQVAKPVITDSVF